MKLWNRILALSLQTFFVSMYVSICCSVALFCALLPPNNYSGGVGELLTRMFTLSLSLFSHFYSSIFFFSLSFSFSLFLFVAFFWLILLVTHDVRASDTLHTIITLGTDRRPLTHIIKLLFLSLSLPLPVLLLLFVR
jgi:hypothetical protein